MNIKKIGVSLVMLVVLILGIYIPLFNNTGFATINTEPAILQEKGSIQLYFCPSSECKTMYSTVPKDASCALYNYEGFTPPEKTIIEWRNYKGTGFKSNNKNLMHNKYCVFDYTVITGSHNPTKNKNRDVVLVINSSILSREYQEAFKRLKNGRSKKSEDSIVNITGTIITAHFCPEDDCREKVVEELKKAEKSIYYLAYSFTDDTIAKELLKTKAQVEGIIDTQKFEGDERETLKKRKLYEYTGAGLLHHKAFIIDEEIVITGSANHTGNGYDNNNENIVIIKDNSIAKEFMKEYERIKKETREVR